MGAIGLCDLYVASISATIRWAIASGIPVINYDIYKFNYQDYIGVQGVMTVFNFNDFSSALHMLTSDSDYLATLGAAQKKHAAEWGLIDGKFAERFHALVNAYLIRSNTTKKVNSL